MNFLILLGGAFCAVAFAAHIISVVAVVLRCRRRGDSPAGDGAAVSILRPVCGLENFIEETLRSTFELDHPRYEVVFCVADGEDTVIPLVQSLIGRTSNGRGQAVDRQFDGQRQSETQ